MMELCKKSQWDDEGQSCIGACIWAGEFKGMPAIVGAYHNGGALYVFKKHKWYLYRKISFKKGITLTDIIPQKCKTCGTEYLSCDKEKQKVE